MAVQYQELTVKDTVKALLPFFFDCVLYWENHGKDEQEAVRLALYDVENIQSDPYSPSGKPLHDMAKHYVIEWLKKTYQQ